jgi:hypothetical protein
VVLLSSVEICGVLDSERSPLELHVEVARLDDTLLARRLLQTLRGAGWENLILLLGYLIAA